MKVRVEELEDLSGPEDVDVDLRRILKDARDERGRTIFEIFGSNDMSELLGGGVVQMGQIQRAPWKQDRRLLQEMDGGKQAWDSLRNRDDSRLEPR